MIRPLLLETVLFLSPFVVYTLWLLTRRVDPRSAQVWREAPVVLLIVVATIIAVAGIVFLGRFESAPAGSAYIPAHLDNGRIVPPTLQ